MKFLLKASAPGDNNYCQVDFFLVDIGPTDLKRLITQRNKCQRLLKSICPDYAWGKVELPDDHVHWQAIEASPTFGDPELLDFLETDCIRLPDDFELDAGHDCIPTDIDTVNFFKDGDVWLESSCGGDRMEAQLPDLATLTTMKITTLAELNEA